MHRPSFVLGYHGCDRSVGEPILAGDHSIQASRNQEDWLGNGAYFWENDPKRAWDWAKKKARRKVNSIKDPFVVGAVIDLGYCLDLTEMQAIEEVRTAYAKLETLHTSTKTPLPINEPGFRSDADEIKRNLDCLVINFVHALREEAGLPSFDTVRSPFLEGKPLFKGSFFKEKTHTQISVLNPQKSIRGYFRVAEDFSEKQER